ncbi:DsrE family protein [Desulfogranum mediterraneum]|uniref:DsrE family protein n=1 Tax=Desulfogranum mediterraneum TaxID=160661 RepID=UPI0003FDCA11|nr:DsrE family protein [Desulfogranum mediterraneum]
MKPRRFKPHSRCTLRGSLFLSLLLSLLLTSPALSMSREELPPDNSQALAGVEEARIVFDINLSSGQKLALYLEVIRQTYHDLLKAGRQPEIILAFRGASVRLISTETWSFGQEEQQSLQQAALILRELKGLGIRLEACAIATKLFKIDQATILPEFRLVGNTFISLMGYQSKGYALIPIQ